MKKRLMGPVKALATFAAAALLALATTTVSAAIVLFDISPPATDAAVGLAGPNAGTGSGATGNEIGGGIFYDDVTKMLSIEFGYGSDHGFVDLMDDWLDTHIHGPAPVGVGVGIVIFLGGLHVAGSSTKTGMFIGPPVGPLPIPPAFEADLLAGLWYINVHTTPGFLGGEIRGQLIPVGVIPLPAAFWLFLGPLAGIAGLRRFTA